MILKHDATKETVNLHVHDCLRTTRWKRQRTFSRQVIILVTPYLKESPLLLSRHKCHCNAVIDNQSKIC